MFFCMTFRLLWLASTAPKWLTQNLSDSTTDVTEPSAGSESMVEEKLDTSTAATTDSTMEDPAIENADEEHNEETETPAGRESMIEENLHTSTAATTDSATENPAIENADEENNKETETPAGSESMVKEHLATSTADEKTTTANTTADNIAPSDSAEAKTPAKTLSQRRFADEEKNQYDVLTKHAGLLKEAEIPKDIVLRDDELSKGLAELYLLPNQNNNFKPSEYTLDVQGKSVTAVAMRWPVLNTVQQAANVLKKCKKRFYISYEYVVNDEYLWHKWQPLLAASFVVNNCLQEEKDSGREVLVDYKDNSSAATKVMVSGTWLASSIESLNHIYYLVQLCVTRCKDLRIDAMLYNFKADKIEIWHGVSLFKSLWCDFDKRLGESLRTHVWALRCEYLKK